VAECASDATTWISSASIIAIASFWTVRPKLPVSELAAHCASAPPATSRDSTSSSLWKIAQRSG